MTDGRVNIQPSSPRNATAYGGISDASAAGTTHSYSADEKVAFVDWMNERLRSDKDLSGILPISHDGDSVFRACQNGILLCKLINSSVPETIDERVINRNPVHPVQKHENQSLVLNSARAIGCNIVNVGASDLIEGIPHLCLGLIWQIIKIGLFAPVNLQNFPGLVRLLEDGETLEQLMALSTDAILIRWVNYHLRRSGTNRRLSNFSGDIKDSEAYAYLLKSIAPPSYGITLDALHTTDLTERAERVLQSADRLDCRRFVRPIDVVKGNPKLNLAFVANLFNHFPCLEPVENVTQVIEETREEKTYRNWMNSLGVEPTVTSLYTDLRDGTVLLQLVDKIQPDVVTWKRVNQPPFSKLGGLPRKLENCNYAIEIGRDTIGMSLVGLAGSDIHEGNKLLTLGMVWQLVRAYTLSILNSLCPGRRIQDSEIISWANDLLVKNRKRSSSSIRTFKDSQIGTGLPIIDLIDALRPGSVDYAIVIDNPTSFSDKLSNARYAISASRKIGAPVFALPDDIVEVKPKMVMVIYACLMMVDSTK